jgi:adenylate cyclase
VTENQGAGARYHPPQPDGHAERWLAPPAGGPRYPFFGKLEIGRDDPKRPEEPGLLLVPDPTISRLHCVVTQRQDGHCFVRDVSRNGTRLAGRRLVPNVETEWRDGEAITIGAREFVLGGGEAARRPWKVDSISTIPMPSRTIATVLVGDIRDYTVLVRTALSEELQRAVTGVFDRLAAEVLAQGGTVKEYQGDAILAYWEGDAEGGQAVRASTAALALHALATHIGQEPAAWPFPDHPLRMDWALATGLVLIDSFGAGQPTGLSMMGEPVVRAFRIEKFATDETGPIVACPFTREAASRAFRFADLGERMAKGFDRPDQVFALLGPADPG